jgi:hypothetical protein
MSVSLNELAVRHGSDKSPDLGHSYVPFYEKLLSKKRASIKAVLEIGVGHPSLMKHIPHYKIGASLFMWRDYFPNAHIYGIDLNPDSIFQDDRIKCFLCDQSDEDGLKRVVGETGALDLIIDDGSHVTEQQIISAKFLRPFSKTYVIEDVKEPVKIIGALGGEVFDFGQEGFPSLDNRIILL